MDTSLLVIPALLGAASIATGLARRHQAIKLAHLLDARTTSVAELLDLQAAVAEQMGAGSFSERVKLSGEIVCAEPLTAPWSGEPCVAHTNTTTSLMEVREESTRTDSEGRTSKEVSWERREETLENLERRCSFELRHGNQMLTVDPTEAELELDKVFSDVEPPREAATFNTRPLGIRREESILRPTGMVFVVAECSDRSGNLQLQAPDNPGLFVIRRGNENDYSRSIRRWRRVWMVSTWVLISLAVAWLLASL